LNYSIAPRSEALFAEALLHIPGGVNSPVRAFRAVGGQPFFVDRAAGAKIKDVDGRWLLDYVCTWGPAILGHAHPAIVQVIKTEVERGTSFGIPTALEVELAREVKARVPSVEKIRFCNSGTEACMSAIRLARGFTGRDKIVKFEGCYHGHGDSLLVKAGSGALTLGQPDSAGIPADLCRHTLVLPFNDFSAAQRAFEEFGAQIAGLIVEGIPANAGLYLPEPGFYDLLATLCKQNGAVFIFDEVMTGFRVAPGGAQELYHLAPDLSCFGKIIGGGLPVGAFGGRGEIMDQIAPLGPVYQAGTLSGNPLAMAAGLATLQQLNLPGTYQLLDELGRQLELGMKEVARRREIEVCWQRIGSMFCGYFTAGPVRNLADAMKSDRTRFARFFHGMLAAGIYLAPSQFESGFISTAHTPDDIDTTIQAADKVFRSL
jgi:glutamate-1-semialdehyde 2,1-aminomutase